MSSSVQSNELTEIIDQKLLEGLHKFIERRSQHEIGIVSQGEVCCVLLCLLQIINYHGSDLISLQIEMNLT